MLKQPVAKLIKFPMKPLSFNFYIISFASFETSLVAFKNFVEL